MESRSPFLKPPPRFAVLGGGMAGLASAFWLSERMPQAHITVLEASDRWGGLVGTRSEGGYLLESGPLAFPTGAPCTAELFQRAGLASRCVPSGTSGGIGLWNGRRIVSVPPSARDVLFGRLLSPRAMLRLLLEPFIPSTSAGRDLSIREFFRRRTGPEFFARLLEPLTTGILAGDPATLSLASNLPQFQAMERKGGRLAGGWLRQRFRSGPRRESSLPRAATSREGCAGLVEGLAEELRRRGVRLVASCAVVGLARSPGSFALRWQARGNPGSGEFDGVISALPSPALAALEADWPVGVREFLERIPHAPLAPVYLAFADQREAPGFAGDGILPQSRASEDILSCFVTSRMAEGRCPPGQTLLRFLLGGARKPHLAALAPSQSEGLAVRAARRILGFAGSPAFSRALQPGATLPQLVVGHREALARCRETLRREWPGFRLAGTSFQGPGIENAVASGRQAAEEAAGQWESETESGGG